MTNTAPKIKLNDGHEIPQLGLGVWQMSDDDVATALGAAFEAGYRHIDTAAAYKNEAAVGKAVRDSGIPRDELFITTKLWNDRHTDAEAACEESLAKLGLDFVDLYLIHWPSPKVGAYETAWQSLVRLRERGLVRSIGVSNFDVANLDVLAEQSDVVPAVNQVELHPSFPQRELRAELERRGIVTEAWSPLGQAKELKDPRIVGIAERLAATPAQVILAWHLAKGIVVFPKSSTPERIRENWAALDLTLPADAIAELDAFEGDNRIGPDPVTADF